jgi:hypothetical protein
MCFGFRLNGFAANLEWLSVDTSQAAIATIAKAPAPRLPTFNKTQQFAADCFFNGFTANVKLLRQCLSVGASAHAISRSFANAALLST